MRVGFSVVAAVVALSNAVPFVEAAIRGATNRRVEQHVQVYRDENGGEVIQSGNVKVHVAPNGDDIIEIGTSHNVVQKMSMNPPTPPAPVPTAPTIPPAPTTPPPTPTGPDGNPSCDLCGGVDASGIGFQLDHVPSDRTNELVDTQIAGPMPCGGLEFAISFGNAATPEECVQYQQNVGSTCCSNKPVASAVEAGIPATKTASAIENFVLEAEGKEGADEETQVQKVPAHTTTTKVFHKEDGDNVKINSFHVAEGKKDGDEELNVQGRPSAADLCRCECVVPDCLPNEYITSCDLGSVGCTMTCGNVPTCGGGGNLTAIDAVPSPFDYEPADVEEVPANDFGYEVNAVGDQLVPAATTGDCHDLPRADQKAWHDSESFHNNCDKYAEESEYCAQYGSQRENFGYVANQACCVCGGGYSFPTVPTTIKSGNDCVTLDGNPADGTNVVMAPCDGSESQKWIIEESRSEYPPNDPCLVLKSSVNTGFCLEASNSGNDPTNMQAWSCKAAEDSRYNQEFDTIFWLETKTLLGNSGYCMTYHSDMNVIGEDKGDHNYSHCYSTAPEFLFVV